MKLSKRLEKWEETAVSNDGFWPDDSDIEHVKELERKAALLDKIDCKLLPGLVISYLYKDFWLMITTDGRWSGSSFQETLSKYFDDLEILDKTREIKE